MGWKRQVEELQCRVVDRVAQDVLGAFGEARRHDPRDETRHRENPRGAYEHCRRQEHEAEQHPEALEQPGGEKKLHEAAQNPGDAEEGPEVGAALVLPGDRVADDDLELVVGER